MFLSSIHSSVGPGSPKGLSGSGLPQSAPAIRFSQKTDHVDSAENPEVFGNPREVALLKVIDKVEAELDQLIVKTDVTSVEEGSLGFKVKSDKEKTLLEADIDVIATSKGKPIINLSAFWPLEGKPTQENVYWSKDYLVPKTGLHSVQDLNREHEGFREKIQRWRRGLIEFFVLPEPGLEPFRRDTGPKKELDRRLAGLVLRLVQETHQKELLAKVLKYSPE